MCLDPASALPTTDTIQAVRRELLFLSLFKVHPLSSFRRSFFLDLNPSLSPPLPLSPNLQFLEDNDRLIGAVSQAYGAGRLDAAAAYQMRLHANLTYLAAVADASTPSAAAAEAHAAQAPPPLPPPPPPPPPHGPPQQQQQQFHAPAPPQMHMRHQGQQQQVYQQGGAPPPPPPRQY